LMDDWMLPIILVVGKLYLKLDGLQG